jgi:hypothetical protein
VGDDVLLVVREELEAELRIAQGHLRLQLLHRRDLAVLAQVDRLRVAHGLVVVADLALLLGDELRAFGRVPRGPG